MPDSHGRMVGGGGVYADCSPPTCSYEGLSLCVCCNSTAPASRRAMSSAYDPSESLFANAWIKTDVSALALCCKRGPVPLAAVAFTASFGWTVWEQSLSCGASPLQHGWQALVWCSRRWLRLACDRSRHKRVQAGKACSVGATLPRLLTRLCFRHGSTAVMAAWCKTHRVDCSGPSISLAAKRWRVRLSCRADKIVP